MPDSHSTTYTSFNGHRRIASGPLSTVALAVKQATANNSTDPILIFDDSTGHVVDIDIRGSDEAVLARFAQPNLAPMSTGAQADKPRERGRPKLGVVAREVTLLPRHWEWLATQPGGASVALRKLVEEARRANGDKDKTRKAQERAYRFISLMAGNMPEFEEATRALFANNEARFYEMASEWPEDLRDYAIKLAFHSDNVNGNTDQATAQDE